MASDRRGCVVRRRQYAGRTRGVICGSPWAGSRRSFQRPEAARSPARPHRRPCRRSAWRPASRAAGGRRRRGRVPRRRSSERRPDCRGRPPERGSWCSARRATGRSPGPCRFFLSPGAVLVSAHNGTVDHRIFVVGIGREMLEDPLPDSRLRPLAEAPVHVFPIPGAFQQIAPEYPGPIAVQHRFDEPPVVDRGHANPTLAPRKQVPDAVPLIIAKSVAAHRSAPERACEKCGYGAILFNIRRMAAISISVSDVCTWYS